MAAVGCGESEPDPEPILDRALRQENLYAFGQVQGSPAENGVAVQSLGHEDAVLDQKLVAAGSEVMTAIRSALGSEEGLRDLIAGLEYEGTDVVKGTVVDHVSGDLDVEGMAQALTKAGGGEVASLAGQAGARSLKQSLVATDFDLYAGQDDGVIRQLDLTIAIDDPDNALPPTRIRFSLAPGPNGENTQ